MVVPLATDPISARMAEAAGFEVLYLGGGTLGYLMTGTEANLSLTQMVQTGVEIHAATTLPVILDGTCGWGDPMHLHHTVSMAEAAGFAAIELEDQLVPRRAHHHIDLEHVIDAELMVQKIQEAVAARRDPDFMIIARTNAARSIGLDEAIRRARLYREAGADILYVLMKDPTEATEIAERLDGPLVYAMLAGIDSIGMSVERLGELGYIFAIDGFTPFLASQRALRESYAALAGHQTDPTIGNDYFGERDLVHQTIDLDKLLKIELRTVEPGHH
jgi:methylisocitrate lyase